MSSTHLQNRSFQVVEKTRTSSKCQKMKYARAKRANLLIFIFVTFLLLWSTWVLKLLIDWRYNELSRSRMYIALKMTTAEVVERLFANFTPHQKLTHSRKDSIGMCLLMHSIHLQLISIIIYTRKTCKSLASGSWFPSFSRVLPTSQVGLLLANPWKMRYIAFIKR